jgi:hypothetical protein
MTTRPSEPPEIAKEAAASADALWAAIEKDMPADSLALDAVKSRVIEALRIAFSRGALLVSLRGMENPQADR